MTAHPIKTIGIDIALANDDDARLEQARDEPAPGGEYHDGKRPSRPPARVLEDEPVRPASSKPVV